MALPSRQLVAMITLPANALGAVSNTAQGHEATYAVELAKAGTFQEHHYLLRATASLLFVLLFLLLMLLIGTILVLLSVVALDRRPQAQPEVAEVGFLAVPVAVSVSLQGCPTEVPFVDAQAGAPRSADANARMALLELQGARGQASAPTRPSEAQTEERHMGALVRGPSTCSGSAAMPIRFEPMEVYERGMAYLRTDAEQMEERHVGALVSGPSVSRSRWVVLPRKFTVTHVDGEYITSIGMTSPATQAEETMAVRHVLEVTCHRKPLSDNTNRRCIRAKCPFCRAICISPRV